MAQKKYHTITVSSLSEYISQMESRINDRYRILLFRGQSIDKALIPKIARHTFKKSREVDEKRMLQEFSTKSFSHLKLNSTTKLEKMTIAQHHGVPTRLLDWTENALTALYFATNKDLPSSQKYAIVWVVSFERKSNYILNDLNTDPFSLKKLRFYKPADIIPRVASQLGWFSIHPKGSGSRKGWYDRVEESLDNDDDSVRLNKFRIHSDCIKKIRETLETCGINEYSIYQDLDSLGRYIFEKYRKD